MARICGDEVLRKRTRMEYSSHCRSSSENSSIHVSLCGGSLLGCGPAPIVTGPRFSSSPQPAREYSHPSRLNSSEENVYAD